MKRFFHISKILISYNHNKIQSHIIQCCDTNKSICGCDINGHLAERKFITSINITSRCRSKRTMRLRSVEYGGPYNCNARNSPEKEKRPITHWRVGTRSICFQIHSMPTRRDGRIIIICLTNANSDIRGFRERNVCIPYNSWIGIENTICLIFNRLFFN